MNRTLNEIALSARRNLFSSLCELGGGHFGACLSEIEILTYLYFEEMNIRPEDPDWSGRDRFVLSKGHGGYGLYSVLAERGFMPKERLSYYENGVMLPKHADRHRIPGVDVSTGSLGQGLSIACGMALAAKRDGSRVRVFSLLGDGECNEGQIWEAAMFACKYQLDNLAAAVDVNALQFDGKCEDVMPMESLADKWQSFGWHVFEADGHDFNEIRKAYVKARDVKKQPTIILFNTIKGKGISFMENVAKWHGGSCNEEELKQGYEDLGIDPYTVIGGGKKI
jgi:transketolase